MTQHSWHRTRGRNTCGEIGGYDGTDPKIDPIGTLERFAAGGERDAWVAEDEYTREAITRREAERMDPEAIR